MVAHVFLFYSLFQLKAKGLTITLSSVLSLIVDYYTACVNSSRAELKIKKYSVAGLKGCPTGKVTK